MRAAISLLVLLLSMCGAQTEVQTESQATGAAAAAEVSSQLDVSAELKELRDMVVEQRVMLRYTQDDVKLLEAENVAVNQRLAASESKVEVLEAENKAVKERLAVSEVENVAVKERLTASESKVEALERALQDTKAEMKMEVDNLKKENAAQEAELVVLKTRLAATESAIQDLNTTSEFTETEVKDLKMDSAAHKQELAALKTGLAATETEVDNLENKIKSAPKVAFSAGLTNSGYIQAGSNNLNLVFSRVITNVGQAYSSTSGFFTAPVRGVYYFRFTVMDHLKSRSMGIIMHKNGQHLMRLYEHDTDGHDTFLSSGLTLQLEKGDAVNMVLPDGRRLYDTTNNHSTFSGFLIFPL